MIVLLQDNLLLAAVSIELRRMAGENRYKLKASLRLEEMQSRLNMEISSVGGGSKMVLWGLWTEMSNANLFSSGRRNKNITGDYEHFIELPLILADDEPASEQVSRMSGLRGRRHSE